MLENKILENSISETRSLKAVVLLSGGLDSTTTLAIARQQGRECYALTFRYGQRHVIEIEAAKRIAIQFQVKRHGIVDLDLAVFGNSALTGNLKVPKNRSLKDISHGIPVTYVPARNTVFLSYALAYSEVNEVNDIFLGVNAIDYSGYPDCRAEYIHAFEQMANLATKSGVDGKRITIHTPLIHLNKAQIIKKGADLGVDYSITHSCYDPASNGMACGQCDSCLLRKKGFADAGIDDPTPYSR